MILVYAAAGLVVGHVLRRITPWLARIHHEGPVFRWPWVELLTATLFAITAWQTPTLPPWVVFVTLLCAITSTDFLCKLIPDRVTFPGAFLGIVFSWVYWPTIHGHLNHGNMAALVGVAPGPVAGLVLGAMGAAVGFGVLEGFRRVMGAVVGMEVMGMGDSKLLMLVGAFLGPSMVLLSIAPGLVFGIGFGVLYTRIAKTPHLPFGPALAAGAFVTALWGESILHGWLSIGKAMRSLTPAASLAISVVLLGIAVWMLMRVRKRRAEYTRQIEEEYESLDSRD